MPDRHPALTGQLFAAGRYGRFGGAGRTRSVVGFGVAAGFDRPSATDARSRIRSRPGIAGGVQRRQLAGRSAVEVSVREGGSTTMGTGATRGAGWLFEFRIRNVRLARDRQPAVWARPS